MRTITTAAVLALLLHGTAFAQTPSSPMTPNTRPISPTNPPPAAAAPRPTPNPLSQENVSQIEGKSVYGANDESLGSVSTVLMNPQTKTIDQLVIQSGGVLGVGGHRYAVPIGKFSWDSQKGAFKVSMDEHSLKSQPEWVEGEKTETGSSAPPARPDAGSSGRTY
jgi:sporulation protein YlmC with PRC-barrel domain